MRAIWIPALIGMAAVVSPNGVYAQASEFGKDEYAKSCAACHGLAGKGDGPVAKSLKQPPPDLTRLSAANKGVFPVSRVYAAIDGTLEILSHGTRDMPVWGEKYPFELKYPGNTWSQAIIDSMVRVRILALIEYISTLQGK